FVGIIAEHGTEPLDRPAIQHIGCGNSPSHFPSPPSPHSHVERSAGAKCEAALCCVDLMRADTEVEENAIGMEFANGGSGGSVCKGGFEVLQAGGAEAAAGRSERFRIAVDAEYGGARVSEDSGVAAAAGRPVDRALAP